MTPEQPTCTCGKVRHLTKRSAKAAIRKFQHKSGRLHPYRCAAGFWHIGHMPPKLTAGEVDRRDLVPRRRSS